MTKNFFEKTLSCAKKHNKSVIFILLFLITLTTIPLERTLNEIETEQRALIYDQLFVIGSDVKYATLEIQAFREFSTLIDEEMRVATGRSREQAIDDFLLKRDELFDYDKQVKLRTARLNSRTMLIAEKDYKARNYPLYLHYLKIMQIFLSSLGAFIVILEETRGVK